MVKLDVSLLRFLEDEDFRVMTALEMSMRNHDVAPTALIERIAQLPHGGARKRLNNLLKHKLIHHENTSYDGYAMKYGAYDYLALRALSKRGTVTGVGSRIGCGKESDIISVQDASGNDCVLKLQRLGRCSFRTVTRNRDYKGNGKKRHGESWFYLSRLASQKEYAFMKMLYDEGFPVPKPIDQNRHALVMEHVRGTLLNHIQEMDQAQKVYERCLSLMVKLAEHGLVHGDFNEFNLFITEDYRVVMIDFPQMISTDHFNAAELFARDVQNLANFFQRRFRVETLFFPKLECDVVRQAELDRQAFASGFFTKKQQMELEKMMDEGKDENGAAASGESSDDGDDDDGGDDRPDEDSSAAEGDPDAGRDGKPLTTGEPDASASLDEVAALGSGGGADGDEEDCEEEDETGGSSSAASSSSGDDTVARAKKARTRRSVEDNPNLNPDGTINEAFIRDQVRRNLRRHDNREFNRTLHRNTQKGREKRKVRRALKSDGDMFHGGGW
jgi:RIO kinase 2